MKLLCPLISNYISNFNAAPARLFIFGGGEILSKEETTRVYPTSMVAYANDWECNGDLYQCFTLCLILF